MDKQRKLDLRRLAADPKAKKIALRTAFCLLAAVVILLLAVMAVRGKKNAPASSGTSSAPSVQTQTGQGSTRGGFPLSFSGESILDVKAGQNGLFVLTKSAVSFVSTSGAYRTPLKHSYVEPVIKAGGKYVLLFDRVTGKFQLGSERKLLFSGQSENGQQITTAAVNEQGDFLVAAKGGNYASLLTFYGKNGTARFSWECAKEYIVSVAIAENRKDLLCAAVSSRNGEMYTKLYLLNVKATETVWETRLLSTAVTECAFAGGNDVLAVCGDRRLIVNTKKADDAVEQADYPASALLCSSDGKGNTAVVNQKLGTFDLYEITVYDKNNKPYVQAQTDHTPLSVFCRGKAAYLLTDSGVYRVRRNGKLHEICKLGETERGLVMVGSDAFHYNKNTLIKN